MHEHAVSAWRYVSLHKSLILVVAVLAAVLAYLHEHQSAYQKVCLTCLSRPVHPVSSYASYPTIVLSIIQYNFTFVTPTPTTPLRRYDTITKR